MVGGDEPQLQVQVVVPLLRADKVEDVVVLHAAHAEDLILVLPRELVLDESREARCRCYCCHHDTSLTKESDGACRREEEVLGMINYDTKFEVSKKFMGGTNSSINTGIK